MPATAPALPAARILFASGLIAALLALSLWIGSAPPGAPLLGVAAVILFLATLVNAEAGLVIIVISMLLSPEIPLASAGGAGLEGSRSVILRSEDLVLLLVGFAWIARMAIHKDLGAIRRTRLNASIGVYIACCLFSTLIGIEAGRIRPAVGLCFVAKYVEYFLVFFITVNYVRSEDRLRRLLLAVLLTAAVIDLYAFAQIPSGVRPTAPFEGKEGEPNTLGGYLVLIFCVSCAIALTATERRWRRGCALLAAGSIPPLLATLSRSSWIGLAASLVALFALAPARRRLAAAAILAAALLFLVHPQSVEQRIAYTFQGEEEESVSVGRVRLDSSSSARLSSWGEAMRAWTRHPIAGWGVTGYGFLDAQYFRILVELGAVGFAAFALLAGSAGRAFHLAFSRLQDPLHRGLGLGMFAGLVGLLAHAVGTNTFMLIRVMEPFWLLSGLVVASLALEPQP
jgi:O-antigen ligase